VHEGALRVHEVELVIASAEDLGDRGGVRDHAYGTHNLGKITTGHNGRGLVVDAALESRRRPIDELNRALGLDRSDGSIHVFRHHVTTVHHAASHVLTVTCVN